MALKFLCLHVAVYHILPGTIISVSSKTMLDVQGNRWMVVLEKCLFCNHTLCHFCRKFMLLYNALRYLPKHIGLALTIACQVGAKEIVRIVLQDDHAIAHEWVDTNVFGKYHEHIFTLYMMSRRLRSADSNKLPSFYTNRTKMSIFKWRTSLCFEIKFLEICIYRQA